MTNIIPRAMNQAYWEKAEFIVGNVAQITFMLSGDNLWVAHFKGEGGRVELHKG